MAQHVESFGAVGLDRLERGVILDRAAQIDQLAVEARGDDLASARAVEHLATVVPRGTLRLCPSSDTVTCALIRGELRQGERGDDKRRHRQRAGGGRQAMGDHEWTHEFMRRTRARSWRSGKLMAPL